MPVTRHHVVHINESLSAKKKSIQIELVNTHINS
jgi:hypothetical protein